MKKYSELFIKIFYTTVFILFFSFSGAQSIFASNIPSSPSLYHISQLGNGTFKEVYTSEFPVKFTAKSFNFENLSDSLTLQVNENGDLPYAGIDAITLNACGANIDATSSFYTDTNKSVLNDILKSDLNVVISHDKTIQTIWNLPQGCSSATLSLNANEYGVGSPFRFPAIGTAQYVMGSNSGSLVIDGKLNEIDGTTPLYAPYWTPVTGHPAGDVYLYAKDDANFLYFAGDIAIDNTDDVGPDWISITIGGKEFKVTDADNTYGTCSFGLTSKVSYKHETCELKIPKNEIANYTTNVPFVLGYYGTMGDIKILSASITGDNEITIVYNTPVTGLISDYSDFTISGGLRNITNYSGNNTNTIVLTFDGVSAGVDSGTIDINNLDNRENSADINTVKAVLSGSYNSMVSTNNFPVFNRKQSGDFSYIITSGTTAELIGYTGSDDDLTIPFILEGYSVTSIADNAFSGKSLNSITIPNSVITIGNGAFANNPLLKIAYFLGDSPNTIGELVFDRADPSFKIVYQNGMHGFINFWDPYITEVNKFNFTVSGLNAQIEEGYDGSGSDLIIPNNLFGYTVTSISNRAFINQSLTSVIIPDTVITIGANSFQNNLGLVSVNIGNGVTSIGDEAFSGDTSLSSAYFLGNAPTIGTGVFDNADSNFKVAYTQGATGFTDYPWNSYFTELKTTTSYILSTLSATSLSSTTATLNGEITSIEGSINPTKRGFQYGPTESYGTITTETGAPTFSVEPYSSNILNLSCGNTYHYRSYTSEDTLGVAYGDDQTFTTGDCPIDFTYTITSEKVKITGYTGVGGDLTIPSTIEGFPVTSIGDNVFEDKSSITGVTFPDTLTEIGMSAFRGTSLSNIVIPDSVTIIKSFAFSNTILNTVTIGSGLSNIQQYVFDKTAEFIVSPDSPYYSSQDGVLFNNNKSIIIIYPQDKPDESYTIPDTVTVILNFQFNNIEKLKSITIPGTIKYISAATFSGNNALSNVTISEGVESIGGSTFSGDNALTSITIPDSVSYIEDGSGSQFGSAFSNDTSLTEFIVGDGNNNYSVQGGVLFNKDKTTLVNYPAGKIDTAYTIPSSVTKISPNAFGGNEFLNTVTIPESIVNIGDNAFYRDSMLASVYFLGNAPELTGSDIFYGTSDSFSINYLAGKTGFEGSPWDSYTVNVPITDSFSLITNGASDVTINSATLSGSITRIDEEGPTVRGFQYGTTIIYGKKSTENAGESNLFDVGSYSSNITNLVCGTTYHYRSYASSSAGLAYGNDQTFMTSFCVLGEPTFPSGEVNYLAANSGISGDDSAGGPFPIGFNFNFYGQDFGDAYLSTNGLLSFDGPNDYYDNTDLSYNTVGNAIYLFWDDLETGFNINMQKDYENVLYTTIGEPGHRKFIAQWTNVYILGGDERTPLGTFQVILYEDTGDIQIQYRYLLQGVVGSGSEATIGISKDATDYLQYSYDTPSLNSGSVVRFNHVNGGSYQLASNVTYDPIYLKHGNIPGSPVLVAPANGSFNTPLVPTLTWNSAQGASEYVVNVSTQKNFEPGSSENQNTPSTIVFSENVGNNTSYEMIGNDLEPNTVYYWFVQAIGESGLGTEISEINSFYTGIAYPDTATGEASLLTKTTAMLSGTITNVRGANATERGFKYGLQKDNYTQSVSENGDFDLETFAANIPDLTCGTIYHYKAYATNSAGIGYGDDQTFTTSSCMESSQVAPDVSGNATVNNTTPEVVITDGNQAVTINVDNDTTDALVNFDALVTNGIGVIPQTTINSDKADVAIPASTTVTSEDTSWNGVIAAPKITTVTLPETSGQTKTVGTAIEVGFSGVKLSFDKAVRISLPNQSGKRAGYTRDGGTTFTEITNICALDDQTTGNALGVDGDCKIDVGSNLIIWTKHFTTFAAYTQTTNSSNTASTTSGGSSAAYMAQYRALVKSTPSTPTCLNGELFNSATGIRCPVIQKNILRNLKLKSTGDDVKLLQIFLNTHGFVVAKSGPGSLNKEINYFGLGTKAAVMKYQKANKLITDGIVGPKMRKVMNNI